MSGLLGAMCVSPAVPEGNAKDVFMSAWDRNVNGQPDNYAFYAHDVRLLCDRRPHTIIFTGSTPPPTTDPTVLS